MFNEKESQEPTKKMIDEITKELKDSLEECMSVFETTGALPSPIMERDYGMLRAMQSDQQNQRYISFMVMNYYIPMYGYKNGGVNK